MLKLEPGALLSTSTASGPHTAALKGPELSRRWDVHALLAPAQPASGSESSRHAPTERRPQLPHALGRAPRECCRMRGKTYEVHLVMPSDTLQCSHVPSCMMLCQPNITRIFSKLFISQLVCKCSSRKNRTAHECGKHHRATGQAAAHVRMAAVQLLASSKGQAGCSLLR